MKKIFCKFTFLIALHLVGIPMGSIAQEVDHWENILAPGDTCKYIIPQTEMPLDWNTLQFDDESWTSGIAGIGYGDGDDNTIEEDILSVYLRIPFQLTNPADISRLLLDMDFDDGFVAYLNGYEIARYNLGVPGQATSYNQLTNTDIEAQVYQGLDPIRFSISKNFIDSLRLGLNIFAVEVHNWSESSSDLSSNPYLQAGIRNSNSYFNPLPDWFDPPVDDQSNLPIVMINTFGQTIYNNERIVADMGLIHNGSDSVNYISDPRNQYDGRIAIEIRGASSTMFPKKSYTIETQNEDGSNNNVPLLGMPSENDWVLYAPYSDKTLLRNVISFRLYDQFGLWSPRTRYVNLYLNEQYQGIYVLMEKIKQDRSRVDILPLSPDANSPVDISGGYILQTDRTDNLAPEEYWTTPTIPPYPGFPRNHFEYYDPEFFDLSVQQSTYIRNWMNSLDLVMKASYFDQEETGYRKYLDVNSFVDYFIFHELNKDVDAYRLSAFFYKRNDIYGGKLVAGPPWDYNLTYGNMYYGGDIRETYGWLYTKSASMYWWKRLMEDEWFKNKVYCRWEELNESLGSAAYIHSLIDSSIAVMASSIDKNFQRWPILGSYVWPNFFIGDTYEEEISFLKNWVNDRVDWLDNQWSGLCDPTAITEEIPDLDEELRIYPNPSSGEPLSLILPDTYFGEYSLSIRDMRGQIVHRKKGIVLHGRAIRLDGLSELYPGIYSISLNFDTGKSLHGKLLRK